MTTIIKMESVENIAEEKMDPTIIDLNILEYLLVCPLNDIFSDNKLVDLIVSNGYYKAAILEGSDLKSLNIKHKDKNHAFIRTFSKSVLTLFNKSDQKRPVIVGAEIIDSSVEPI